MIRAAVRAWGAGGRADEIELVADEMITNALMHTDGPAVVTLRVITASDRRLRVDVEDTSSALPRRLRGGRGRRLGARPAPRGPARGRVGRGGAGERQVRVVRVRGAGQGLTQGAATAHLALSVPGGTLDVCRNYPRSKR